MSAGTSSLKRVTRPWSSWAISGLGLVFAAWLGWLLLDWAVLQAVFRVDPEACRAVGHQGACWGVIAEKAGPILLGHFPQNDQTWGGLPLTLSLFVLSLGLSLPFALALALGRRSARPWLSWPVVPHRAAALAPRLRRTSM